MAKNKSVREKSILDLRAEQMHKTLEGVVKFEIEEYVKSKKYEQIQEARSYTLNRSDVQTKSNTVASRSNTKIEHSLLYKLTKQKTNFLLSKEFTIETKSSDYEGKLKKIFDKNFRKKLKYFGFSVIEYGINYWLPYIDDNKKFKLKSLTPLNTKVYWTDEEHEEIEAFLYFYTEVRYNSSGSYKIKCAEYWDKNGVRYFETNDNELGDYIQDKKRGNKSNGYAEPHLQINGKAYNWEVVPLVWAKYNQEELSLQYWLKELIDDINWQTSITSDVVRDIAKFIYILKNYGGQDLAEFIKDLRENLAIKVDADGGVDKLQADLNIESVLKFIEKQRKDCYDYGACVDTKDENLGNASGKSLNFRYTDLIDDCENIANELDCMFEKLKYFIDIYLNVTGQGNFVETEFSVIFNMDMPVNESDIISDIKESVGIISNKTLIANHPYTKNVQDEIDQIKKEEAEQMNDDYINLGGGSDGEE